MEKHRNTCYVDHHFDVAVYCDECGNLADWHWGTTREDLADAEARGCLDAHGADPNAGAAEALRAMLGKHPHPFCFCDRVVLDDFGPELVAWIVDFDYSLEDGGEDAWPRFVFTGRRYGMPWGLTTPMPKELAEYMRRECRTLEADALLRAADRSVARPGANG